MSWGSMTLAVQQQNSPSSYKSNRTETLLVRIVCILLVGIGVTMGCDRHRSCIEVGANGEFGTNHIEKIEMVSRFATGLGLPTTSLDAAAIVGAAYAASQVEGGQAGVPVMICLRAGQGEDTEYRVITTAGKPLIEWISTTEFRAP